MAENTASGFDAIVLAVSPHAHAGVAGLSLVERGRRVVDRLGARRVTIVERAEDAAAVAAWAAGREGRALLVVRAGDQVVHTPLVAPLASAAGPRRLAVDDDGTFAGALWAEGESADEAVAAIAAAPATADQDLARRWIDATRVKHGPIARHPATTKAERAGARRMLFGMIVKAEDGPLSRYIYRPVSGFLTRGLVHTPITPNQISLVTAVLGFVGCWLSARGDHTGLWVGALFFLIAAFIDGCDGEIARIKLQFSRFGAWLDTIIDEAGTTGYLIALGIHTHRRLPDDGWVIPSLIASTVCYVAAIYGIYYFLVVVSKSGNSQHYATRLDLVDDPVQGPALRRPVPTESKLPRWLRTLGFMFAQVVRREFINLGALALAIADQYLFIYVTMALGGLVTFAVVIPAHVRLIGQLAELRRRGAAPRLLAS